MNAEHKLPVRLSGYCYSLIYISLLALALSIYRILVTHTDKYWFLVWNLILAWVPLVFAWLLHRRTPKGIFWSWRNFVLMIVWLLFLPNAFYLITDFIHLQSTSGISLMFDVVLFSVYGWCGFILGYSSLLLVHQATYKRFGLKAHWLAVGALLLSGFAIYLGRYLRWNSWDIITNPFGLLFDVSDSIVNPSVNSLSLGTTLLFFAFLSSIYMVLWNGVKVISKSLKK
jgi:uncharacterized membrane protein